MPRATRLERARQWIVSASTATCSTQNRVSCGSAAPWRRSAAGTTPAHRLAHQPHGPACRFEAAARRRHHTSRGRQRPHHPDPPPQPPDRHAHQAHPRRGRPKQHQSLTDIYGIGALVVADIITEAGDPGRYETKARFAMANGTAPLEASSGRVVRHRLNRGGNRQLNKALHTAAIAQIESHRVSVRFIMPVVGRALSPSCLGSKSGNCGEEPCLLCWYGRKAWKFML